MKTLLERAKAPLLRALEAQKLKYPNLAADTEGHLGSIFFATDLRFGTWMDCKSLWKQATGDLIDSPWDLFEEN